VASLRALATRLAANLPAVDATKTTFMGWRPREAIEAPSREVTEAIALEARFSRAMKYTLDSLLGR